MVPTSLTPPTIGPGYTAIILYLCINRQRIIIADTLSIALSPPLLLPLHTCIARFEIFYRDSAHSFNGRVFFRIFSPSLLFFPLFFFKKDLTDFLSFLMQLKSFEFWGIDEILYRASELFEFFISSYVFKKLWNFKKVENIVRCIRRILREILEILLSVWILWIFVAFTNSREIEKYRALK